jgi:hypothetical protein
MKEFLMFNVIGKVQSVIEDDKQRSMKVLVKTVSFGNPDVVLMRVYHADSWPSMKQFLEKNIMFSFSHYYSEKTKSIAYSGTDQVKPQQVNESKVA